MTELDKTLDKYSNDLPTEEITENGESAEELNKRLAKGEDENSSVVGKEVTGLTGGIAENYDWEIFYADENNIYLISTDYIQCKDFPKKDNEGWNTNSEYGGRCSSNLFSKYDGVGSITREEIRSLNSDFINKYSTSKNTNMKIVAYLLDVEIWTNQFVGENNKKVNYVIGCPSIELLYKAYNAKYGTNYSAQATSVGYKVVSGSSLSSSDPTFVISSQDKASAMWIASPAYPASDNVMFLKSNGSINYNYYLTNGHGIRPVICLDSKTQLKELEDGTFKLI